METLSVPDDMLGPVRRVRAVSWGEGGAMQLMSTGKQRLQVPATARLACSKKCSEKAAGNEQEQHINSCHIKKCKETPGLKNTVRQTFMKSFSTGKYLATV